MTRARRKRFGAVTQRALEMQAVGVEIFQIARELGVEFSIIERRLDLAHAGGGARPVTDRSCLRCRGVFASEGAHHRICNDCKESSDYSGLSSQFDGASAGRRVRLNAA